MARTAHGSRASAPSPYTVSVGNATSPPRRISAAASSRSAGDLALSSRVSTSRNAFERRLVDSFADQLRDRAAPGLPQLGDPCLQHALDDQRGPADLPDVLERRAGGLADRFHGLAIRRCERDDDARGILSEEQRVGTQLRLQRHATPEVAAEAHLRQRYREPAVGAVVRRLQQPGAHAVPDRLLHRPLACEIERRRYARDPAVDGLEVLATDAGDVTRGLRHGVRRAEARIEVTPAGVAPDRHRYSAVALAGEPHHSGIALAGPDGGPDADHVIVLAVDPLLGSDRRRSEYLLQRDDQVPGLRYLTQLLHLVLPDWPPARPIVCGSIAGERRDRELRDGSAAALHHQLARDRDTADDRVGQVPLVADVEDFLLTALLRHQQHALLRFAEHHLVGRHARLPARDRVDVQLEPGARARGHLDRR